MRIAIVTPYDLSAASGVNVYAQTTARWLRGRGHDIAVFGPATPHASLPEGCVRVGRPRPVRIGGTSVPIALTPAAWGELRRALRGGNFDIVHVHEPCMPLLSWSALGHTGAPLVGTFHGVEPWGVRLTRAAAPLLRRRTRRLAAATAVSAAAARAAAPVAGAVEVIPCPVEVERFAAPSAPPSLTPNGRRILYVGRADPRKGLATLLEAHARLRAESPDVELVVVGPRDAAMRRLAARDAANGASVRFCGPVPHDELPGWYQSASVFCAPARSGEAFGLVLAEAMAAGTPVVAGDNPGYRAVVGDAGLLTPPDDPEALAAALRRVLSEPETAQALRAAGRRRVAEFAIESVGRRLLALYDRTRQGWRT